MGSINWSDSDVKDKIKSDLEGMNIAWTDSIGIFVEEAFKAANAVSIIDFETLNQDLKNVYDLLNSIHSGE
jgi:hypothetical protein